MTSDSKSPPKHNHHINFRWISLLQPSLQGPTPIIVCMYWAACIALAGRHKEKCNANVLFKPIPLTSLLRQPSSHTHSPITLLVVFSIFN